MPTLYSELPLRDEKSYYEDTHFISFSGLKLFSKCQNFYKEVHLDKTLEQEDHDYFIYGKVVDALITETPEYFIDHFQIVNRTINPEDKLKYEMKIKELEQEIKDREEKAANGNKVAIKGIESRKTDIAELASRIAAIESTGEKVQVTTSIYENATMTALAIKNHPSFNLFQFSNLTSQQILVTDFEFNGNIFHLKGRLDYLELSPLVRDLYAQFVNSQISYEEMRTQISNLPPEKREAIIADVKTCRDLRKLDLNNTHYKGQLAFYRLLVSNFFGIPKEQIKCYIIAGDKMSGQLKHAEIFSYGRELLDDMEPTLVTWMKIMDMALKENRFVSARQLEGVKQECFTCSDCRIAPFSPTGAPVEVSQTLIDYINGKPAEVAASEELY